MKKNERPYWNELREIARIIQSGPNWLKAGISLNPKHFFTYAPDEDLDRPAESD